jgi:hypothetical protein
MQQIRSETSTKAQKRQALYKIVLFVQTYTVSSGHKYYDKSSYECGSANVIWECGMVKDKIGKAIPITGRGGQ